MLQMRPGGLAMLLGATLLTGGFSSARAAAETSPQRVGTTVVFHGWSPDGRYVAYTRVQRPAAPARRGSRAGKPRVREIHRRIVDGRLAESGPAFGQDIASYAREHGYRPGGRPGVALDDRLVRFDVPEGSYVFDVQVGDKMYWELSFEGDVIVRRAFDQLYVDVQPELYPSPDRRQAIVVLHLDRGWAMEAAVYPVELPQAIRRRWESLTPTRPAAAPGP